MNELQRLKQAGIDVRRMVADSRQVGAGDVFVAMPGSKHDPRQDIPAVLKAGAAAVIWEQDGFEWHSEWQVPNMPVKNLRAVIGELSSAALDHPSEKLWVAGVTGTNGKTSCSHWIAQSLCGLGKRTGIVGTLGNGFPQHLSQATHTTPDVVSLHRLLARFRDEAAFGVAMEVSSHGLDQCRVNGVRFSAALFTNLTRDHLDYHGNMANYAAAKRKLFLWQSLRHAVVNLDDEFGAHLASDLAGSALQVMGYGFGKGEISGHNLDLSQRGLRLEIQTPWGKGEIESKMLGAYNASNLLGVLGMLLAADVPLASAVDMLNKLEPVDGRLQIVTSARTHSGPLVIVDYAHSPDALEKVLQALRQIRAQDAKLICVFGCGGERDPGKRPLMGEIATRLSDLSVITSDNPRGEDPQHIVDAILTGVRGPHRVHVDRAVAIDQAIGHARAHDIVLIAGKGHETYQEVRGERIAFDDRDVARAALERHHA